MQSVSPGDAQTSKNKADVDVEVLGGQGVWIAHVGEIDGQEAQGRAGRRGGLVPAGARELSRKKTMRTRTPSNGS